MGTLQNRVLILCDYYLPGYKAGGPIRTLANLVDQLGDELQFKLLTRNNDLGETKAYPGITPDSWSRIGKAEVCHLAPGSRTLPALRRWISATEHDALYINSLFSYTFSIKPLLMRRMGLIPRVPVVLAPRGELSPGALALKRVKKRLYLMAAKVLGLHRDIIWDAASDYEAVDIRRWFGDRDMVKVAPNLPARVPAANVQDARHEKTAGSLKIVFLSRIDRKKNLDSALMMLDGVEGEIEFNIYGPLEDRNYWAECEKIISRLPANIQVRHCGSVEHDRAVAALREHDLFFMPTRGENFGHVIVEALLAGCPVLISDQTPWRDLEQKGIGWDLPLSDVAGFRAALKRCVEMGVQEHTRWSEAARSFALTLTRDESVVEQNRRLFQAALSMSNNGREG